jgi:Tol biopolymer transport system component
MHPNWSPDGKKLAWSKLMHGQDDAAGIEIGDYDAMVGSFTNGSISGVRNVTPVLDPPFELVETHDFSPSGKLLFSGQREGWDSEQYELDLTTGALENLTNNSARWDEHGTYLVNSERFVWASANANGSLDVWISDPHERLLAFNDPSSRLWQGEGVYATGTDWRQDGRKLAATVQGLLFATYPDTWQTVVTFAGECGRD